MKKRLVTIFMVVVMCFCCTLSVMNFNIKDASADAEYGTMTPVYFLGLLLWYDCEGAASNCVIVTPEQ